MTNVEARFNKSLRPRKPEGSLGRTAQRDVHLDSHSAPELCRDRRHYSGTVKAVSPRHCAATSVLRTQLLFPATAVLGQSHKDSWQCPLRHRCRRSSAVTTQSKKGPAFTAQLFLPAHDIFCANLRVQHHLPPLPSQWSRLDSLSQVEGPAPPQSFLFISPPWPSE